MFNPKLITVSAVIGFILSFFAGLIAGVPFGTVLFRAIISALCFSGVFYAVWFVFTKFLNQDSGETNDEPNHAQTGSLVDITIDDESLPDDGTAPGFYVDNSVQSTGAQKIYDSKPLNSRNSNSFSSGSSAEGIGSETSSFVPVQLGKSTAHQESSGSGPDVHSVQTSETVSHRDSHKHEQYDDEGLDDLPDIGSIIPDLKTVHHSSAGAAQGSEDIHSEAGNKIEVSSITSSKDPTVMAQTIRTMLLKDG